MTTTANTSDKAHRINAAAIKAGIIAKLGAGLTARTRSDVGIAGHEEFYIKSADGAEVVVNITTQHQKTSFSWREGPFTGTYRIAIRPTNRYGSEWTNHRLISVDCKNFDEKVAEIAAAMVPNKLQEYRDAEAASNRAARVAEEHAIARAIAEPLLEAVKGEYMMPYDTVAVAGNGTFRVTFNNLSAEQMRQVLWAAEKSGAIKRK